MAKITITIEDTPERGVHIVSDPPLEQLQAMAAQPGKCSSAHGYAFAAMLAIHQISMQASIDAGGKRH